MVIADHSDLKKLTADAHEQVQTIMHQTDKVVSLERIFISLSRLTQMLTDMLHDLKESHVITIQVHSFYTWFIVTEPHIKHV